MFRRIGVFVVGIILLYLLFHHFISPQRISSEIYESVYIKQVRKLNNILAQCPNTNIKNYLANFTTCPTTSNVHQLILTLEKYCQTNKANTCKTPQDGVRLLSEDSDMYSDFVNYGGWWMPTDCVERDSTAIVIPLSPWNELRFKYLSTLLRNLHPILRHQKLHYRIFVVVQDAQSAYNRGKLFNIGYTEALRIFPFTCFVFQDPDVIPRDATVPYDCSASPMYIPLVNQSTHEAGGVFMFRTHHYNKVPAFPSVLVHISMGLVVCFLLMKFLFVIPFLRVHMIFLCICL